MYFSTGYALVTIKSMFVYLSVSVRTGFTKTSLCPFTTQHCANDN